MYFNKNILQNKILLNELLKQTDLHNTINGGTSHTLIEYAGFKDKLIMKVSSPAVSGHAYKILVDGDQFTILAILRGFGKGLLLSDMRKVPLFRRTFVIPQNVDPTKIETMIEGEEFCVVLPLKDNQQPKQLVNKR